jgi:hypothetical protein
MNPIFVVMLVCDTIETLGLERTKTFEFSMN